MDVIAGQLLEACAVRLDGTQFTDCVFRDVVLEFHGTEGFGLEACDLHNVRFAYLGNAGTVITMLKRMAGDKNLKGFIPEILP